LKRKKARREVKNERREEEAGAVLPWRESRKKNETEKDEREGN